MTGSSSSGFEVDRRRPWRMPSPHFAAARGRFPRRGLLQSFGAAAAALALPAVANESPPVSQPVRIFLPFAPGGAGDAWARLICDRLSQLWRVPVVLENRPGANGAVAAAALANAPPNGHTLFFANSGVVLAPLLLRNPPYRLSQLAPVQFMADLPIALGVARRDAAGLEALLAKARARPGEVAYATYGVASAGHILAEMLQKQAGVRMVHVPYRGEAEAIPALISGQVSALLGSVSGVANQAEHMVFAAVANPSRLQRFPDVPTLAEAGFAAGELSGWAAAFAPAGTPAPLVERIAADLREVMAREDVTARTRDVGFEPREGGGPPLAGFLGQQSELWAAALRETGIRIE